jgi:SAM-dependent methyltransferase
LGNGAGGIHPVAARTERERVVRNRNNYRISPADGVGAGSPKEKCRANLAAIKLVRKLQAENRPATQEEKSALVRYVGWGGLPQIFNPATDWQAESRELAKLISKEEFRLARASTLNAHYTSGEIIQGMYAALERLGFKEGRILEPACGIGHFVGFMPESMKSKSVITGIELDPVTAQIAKALYPDADIRNEAFEKANVADEFYDVAISNIPFGDYKPFDTKFNKQGFLIHDYFFARGLEKVRPGGIVMFITSRGTMDKMDNTLRKYVNERANLIGAIRLPNTAFKRNANTEVTTDIIILKKLRPRETTKGVKWEKVIPYTSTNGEVIPINEYFVNNQHMMLGEMQLKGRMYSQSQPTLVSDPDLPLLFSLENYDSETNKAVKTAIFRERTIQKQKPITSVQSPKEAVIVSLNEKGRVDLEHMASLLNRPADEFLPELKGVLFLNPQTQLWETEDHYLSGDVRDKLRIAEAASLTEPRFQENVAALKSVQPEDLSATQIDARLGACWIPVKDFEKFARELLAADDIKVLFTAQLGTWTVQAGPSTKGSVANTTEWGTNRASALELVEDALNLRTPTIYDTVKDGKKDKQVVNANSTEGAREKQQKIKDRFREWVSIAAKRRA